MRVRLLKQVTSKLRTTDQKVGDYDIVWAGSPPQVITLQGTGVYMFAWTDATDETPIHNYRETDRWVNINEGMRIDDKT